MKPFFRFTQIVTLFTQPYLIPFIGLISRANFLIENSLFQNFSLFFKSQTYIPRHISKKYFIDYIRYTSI
jgi:hypothetical protein